MCAQLRDSAPVGEMTPVSLVMYARACEFDRSVTGFTRCRVDQNELDYDEFAAAVRRGQVAAAEGA